MADERDEIVEKLAVYLYETEQRLDPGTRERAWSEIDDFTRAFLR